jgi:hypothetical protein
VTDIIPFSELSEAFEFLLSNPSVLKSSDGRSSVLHAPQSAIRRRIHTQNDNSRMKRQHMEAQQQADGRIHRQNDKPSAQYYS